MKAKRGSTGAVGATFAGKPIPVKDLDIAFGGNMRLLMPPISSIPKGGFGEWNKAFADFFYSGAKGIEMYPKDGIDPSEAWRHVRCIMGSYEPKHEHKEGACAYLLSLWFKGISYETRGTRVKIGECPESSRQESPSKEKA